jgi:Uncharacterised protein family (UPF0158)
LTAAGGGVRRPWPAAAEARGETRQRRPVGATVVCARPQLSPNPLGRKRSNVMPAEVSLQDIVEAMDLPNSEWEAFLDPDSGEIVTITDDDRSSLEEEEPEHLPEWQREQLPRIREVLESERFLRLPDPSEIHEWSIMERFCHSIDSPFARAQLLDAIHGTGAFRLFRSTLERLALLDRWYSFRGAAFEEIAREWLRAHGIPFK